MAFQPASVFLYGHSCFADFFNRAEQEAPLNLSLQRQKSHTQSTTSSQSTHSSSNEANETDTTNSDDQLDLTSAAALGELAVGAHGAHPSTMTTPGSAPATPQPITMTMTPMANNNNHNHHGGPNHHMNTMSTISINSINTNNHNNHNNHHHHHRHHHSGSSPSSTSSTISNSSSSISAGSNSSSNSNNSTSGSMHPLHHRPMFLQQHHHHHHHHHHHELGPVHKADSDDLDRIRNFIEQFKARRGALGLTQKQAAQCFRAFTNDRYAFSDNFVGHFEGFQFRPQTAMTIADSLAEWLEFAENETRQGRQLSFMPGKVKETRKRKYEVIRIRDSAKRVLVEAFEKNRSPSTSELEQLSRKTNIPSRNIEIFFKNRRTSRQYHQ